jgi:oxygen-independent coproporphyrinogen-3 oxidase
MPRPCKKKQDELCPDRSRGETTEPDGARSAGLAGLAGSLYVHVPFCTRKCRYCDFYSVPFTPGAAERFARAAERELAARRNRLTKPLSTVFFGGGTPTCLGAELLGRLLRAVRPLVDPAAEFSVEANPATLDENVIAALAAAGVNRVNVGVQSFRDADLRVLGRAHDAAGAREALGRLRQAGFENIGLDLIYGIPGQDLAAWRASLSEAIALAPEHLSCYGLSFESGTPLEADRRAGRVSEVCDDLQRQCYRRAIADAEAAGLPQYEISNFARPDRRCRHNLTYWHNRAYVGIGPGAAGYLDGVRTTNTPDVEAYVDALEAGRAVPRTAERLTGRRALAEAAMLGLRLIEGIDRRCFADRYGIDAVEALPRSLGRYERLGAVEVTADHVRIRRDALFVADTILADLIAEA